MIRRDYDLMEVRAEIRTPLGRKKICGSVTSSIKPAIEKSLIFFLALGASEHE